MGYRSEVAITLTEKDFNRMVEELKQPCNNEAKILFNDAIKTKFDDYITLHWDWVKWYEDFEDVQYFENFYKKCDTYKYIRIGENDDDTEINYKGKWISSTEYLRKIECYGDEIENVLID